MLSVANKINHENTPEVSVKDKPEKHEIFMIFFVFSCFRDFVIKELFTFSYINLDLRLINSAKSALAFLEISQYGHELFF